MTRTALALILITLAACDQAPPMEAPYVWQPLPCDTVEEVVYVVTDDADPDRLRTVTTTRSTVVSIVDAEPVSVVARVMRPERSPCSSVEGCGVVRDTSLSPDGRHVYFAAGTDVVTGLDTGETRVVCSVTHESRVTIQRPGVPIEDYEPAPTTELRAEGGEYVIAGVP